MEGDGKKGNRTYSTKQMTGNEAAGLSGLNFP